jgi:hypothetical protein
VDEYEYVDVWDPGLVRSCIPVESESVGVGRGFFKATQYLLCLLGF